MFKRTAHAQQAAPAITAHFVSQAPTDPEDSQWLGTARADIQLSPQNLVLPRINEAGTTRLSVKALYDSSRLSVYLEWGDPDRNAELGTVMQFRDGVAMQFPEDPAAGTPSFTMGQETKPVTIYHWKSDWQFGRTYDVDEAYPNMYADGYDFSGKEAGEMAESSDYITSGDITYLTAAAAGNANANPLTQEEIGPVQKMQAKGFGTLEPHENQDAQGQGTWKDGVWKVVISVPKTQERFAFDSTATIPLGFAVWNGARQERNGQKAFSQWNDTRLVTAGEQSTATPVAPRESKDDTGVNLVPYVGGGVVTAILAAAALVGLYNRRRADRQQK